MVVDTPGFSSFDPGQMALDNREDIEAAFPELAPYAGNCRFIDCAHLREPDCAVRAAMEAGELAASRYDSYLKLVENARERRAREYK
jgi:ribosome biogenesis GTPase